MRTNIYLTMVAIVYVSFYRTDCLNNVTFKLW